LRANAFECWRGYLRRQCGLDWPPLEESGRKATSYAMSELLSDPELWVTVSFLIFLAILAWLGVPRMIVSKLDERSVRIRAELDEAKRLHEEAAAILAQYRRRQENAEKEAAAIIRNAQDEALRLTEEAQAKVEEFIARHTKMAESRIAQAEVQALADVRSAAADAAVTAAERVLVDTVRGATADALITQGVRELKGKLN
jgi:F-type H+-transporting ATPase subunit b